MLQTFSYPSRTIIVAATLLLGTLTASAAHADDPLAQIKSTIERDHGKACQNFSRLNYNKDLEAIAQAYARSEKAPQTPAGFDEFTAYLGAGDPEAQAITRTYEHGADRRIRKCDDVEPVEYGVGFIRHNDRSVDVVTMVFGKLAWPKPDPNAPRPRIPAIK